MNSPSEMKADVERRLPWLWPRSAYVHIPFCAHHCCYCDFAVAAGVDDQIDCYLDALQAELQRLNEPQRVQTLFLGGGTPTHLSVEQLARLFGLLQRWLPLEAGHELSVEANPATLSACKMQVMREHGVNRISLGAQSFADSTLAFLERDHHASDIARVVEIARQHFASVSLDLIFGVPGQDRQQWRRDIEQALGLGVDHVATYGLTYEKGTRLWKDAQAGRVRPLDEDTELGFYEEAMDCLEGAGFEHYEISNFARPGSHCRHNEVYWANHAYFGFGMGAASYVQGVREVNTRELAGYLRKALAGEPLAFQSECLNEAERALETACIQMRRACGIDRPAFREQTGFDVAAVIGDRARRLIEQELLIDDGQHLRLSRRGKCLADWVVSDLMRSDFAG